MYKNIKAYSESGVQNTRLAENRELFRRLLRDGLTEALGQLMPSGSSTAVTKTRSENFQATLQRLTGLINLYTLFKDLPGPRYNINGVQNALRNMGINDPNIAALLFTKRRNGFSDIYEINSPRNGMTTPEYHEHLKTTVIPNYVNGLNKIDDREKKQLITRTSLFIDILYAKPSERNSQLARCTTALNEETQKLAVKYNLNITNYTKFSGFLLAVSNGLETYPENVLEVKRLTNGYYIWDLRADFLAPYLTSYSYSELNKCGMSSLVIEHFFLETPSNSARYVPRLDRDITAYFVDNAGVYTSGQVQSIKAKLHELIGPDFRFINTMKDFLMNVYKLQLDKEQQAAS